MNMSNSEKFIIVMLASICKKFDIRDDVDPEFVLDAIHRDFTWALSEEYSGIFGDNVEAEPEEVSDVHVILGAWEIIERTYKEFNETTQQEIRDANHGEDVKFPGFDGNAGNRHLHIAEYLIGVMHLYQWFDKRKINSHTEYTTDLHKRMLPEYKKIIRYSTRLSPSQIIKVIT